MSRLQSLCREELSAERQRSLRLQPLPHITAVPQSCKRPQSWSGVLLQKQLSSWGAWEVGEIVYFFAEEEGGLEGGRQLKASLYTSPAPLIRSSYTRKVWTASLEEPLPFPWPQAWSRAGHTHLWCCLSADKNLAQQLEKPRKIPSSQKHISLIELNVKNQQPTLPGEQLMEGKTTKRTSLSVCVGQTDHKAPSSTTELKNKLRQSQRMMRRKKASVGITVGGCWDTPMGL